MEKTFLAVFGLLPEVGVGVGRRVGRGVRTMKLESLVFPGSVSKKRTSLLHGHARVLSPVFFLKMETVRSRSFSLNIGKDGV